MGDQPPAHVVAAPLRDVVSGCQGYLAPHRPGGVHRGLPSGSLTIVLTLDTPLTVLDGGRCVTHDAVVGGLADRPVLMTWERRQTGIQLDLTALGARRLLGVPVADLAGAVLPLTDLWGRGGADVVDRLRETPTWPQRWALLDRLLLERLVDAPAPAPELARAWQRLTDLDGRVRVADLAAEVGWSRRHLAHRFTRDLGLSPQAVGRVLRFDHARRRLDGVRTVSQVAADAGYADHSHLVRDFHAFAGCTPSQWVAEELPSVQAERVGERAG
jgi:AraC-like DNA-binding protein